MCRKGEADGVTTFEDGFTEAERSADSAPKAGSAVVAAAKQMKKAAQEGDIAKVRTTAERLGTAVDAARQHGANARSAWPFTEQEERNYLEHDYEGEIRGEAEGQELSMFARDGRLLVFPSILQILPEARAVRVDRKRVTSIRPSHLVKMLLDNQSRKPRFKVEQYIESLHLTYKLVLAKGDVGGVVKLAQIYQAFTLQPGSAAEYSKSDFARDIFLVDQSGVTRTRSGAVLSLPASTGTRSGGGDVFTFVDRKGEVLTYYGLRFQEG